MGEGADSKAHVETVGGGRNILPFCRKHLGIDEKVKNVKWKKSWHYKNYFQFNSSLNYVYG